MTSHSTESDLPLTQLEQAEGCFDTKFEIRFRTQRPKADGKGMVDDFDVEVRNENLNRTFLVDELSGGQFVLVNSGVGMKEGEVVRGRLMKYLSAFILILLGVTLFGGPRLLQTQTAAGKILGRVSDATHADLFDVAITVTNAGAGISRRVRTDEYGKYAVDSLLPGIYTIRAEGEGLKTNQVTGVKLKAAEDHTVDLVMELAKERIPPRLAKPAPITMAELAKIRTAGVSAVEISDYVYGNYQGPLAPSPPHADINPRKAYIVFWKDVPYRLVFSHEGSYCPWLELPSGAGLSYQFLEGNTGWAELMNQWGRQEANSFVSVVESGPKRVWVRWTYFGVNIDTGQKAYRGTEDFWAYPNGLVVRRQEYETLLPGQYNGYSREPIELIGL